MADIVEKVVEALRNLLLDKRNDLARYIIALAEVPVVLTPKEEAALAEADAEIARGEFVSPEEMAAF